MKWFIVWTGNKYSVKYVNHLRKNLPGKMACLTDHQNLPSGIEKIDVTSYDLDGWWNKMLLFDPRLRGDEPACFVDLDTVVLGPPTKLAELTESEKFAFGVCRNFQHEIGNVAWPCKYGSCVMTFATGFGKDIYDQFMKHRDTFIKSAGKYGDQHLIERLYPQAEFLQDYLPDGFFVHKTKLDYLTPNASLGIFAGKETPENTHHKWIRDMWP